MRNECEDGHEFYCSRCDNELEMTSPRPCEFVMECKYCNAEMDRLEEIEEKYLALLTKYDGLNELYTTLQDHLKCLLT